MYKKALLFFVCCLMIGMFPTFVSAKSKSNYYAPSEAPGRVDPGGIKNPTGVIIPCPQQLLNVQVTMDANYSKPQGWSGLGYDKSYGSITLKRFSHSVSPQGMFCHYAYSGAPTSLIITSIKKPIPPGKTCTKQSNFKFLCQ